MVTGLNQALSIKIFLVSFVTPLYRPPYTPPIHIGPSPLHIMRSSANNFLSFSSRLINSVPSGKFFTIIFLPVILSASKACRGWPVSCNIKLVISTILLIGLRPMLFNFCCSHRGLSPMLTPWRLTPAYRWQASLFSISISICNECTSLFGSDVRGVFPKGDFTCVSFLLWCESQAHTSFATPKWLIASIRLGVRPISKI